MRTFLDTLKKKYISKILTLIFEDLPWKCVSVRDTLTRVPPLDLRQFIRIWENLISWLYWWLNACVQFSTKWLNLRRSYLLRHCVYTWLGPAAGTNVVCQLWAHESDWRYSTGLIPARSLAWLLWHEVLSLPHFTLTLWSCFTPSDCYFTSPRSKELESTCPGCVTHERESINSYRFSSFCCKALSQSSSPS